MFLSMEADGSDLRNITDNPHFNGYPAWPPAGQQIAFESNRDGNWEVYVMNVDGTGQSRLTDNEERDLSPAWRRRQ